MREIKFRAWDETEKHMYNWENLLNQNLKNIFTIPNQCGYNIMQYTGLKDKNGKEIYDGDIVKNSFYLENKFEVCWKECSWYLKNVKTSEYIRLEEIFSLRPHYDLEIIGNIYDNPELLEKGD